MAGREAVVVASLVSLLGILAPVGAARAAPAAGAPDLDRAAAGLASPATQAAALRALEALGDPAVAGLLKALKEGGLYRHQGGVALLGDDGALTDLRGQPLRDAAGNPVEPPAGEEAVALEEQHFGLVRQVLERLEIFGPDPAARKTAAFRLGGSQDPAAIAVLERALERERLRDVRTVMEEALARLRLAAPDPRVRAVAAEALGRLRAESALGQLQAALQQETDPEARRAMAAALKGLDSFLVLRNVLGFLFNGVSLGAVLLIMSLGLAVTFGLMGIINMAHGEMLMIGSYTAYVVQEVFAAHYPGYQDHYFLVALPLSFLAAGLVGLALETGLLRYLYGRPLETLIVTWGVGMILQQGARLTFGDQTSVNPPTWLRGGLEVARGLIFPWSRIFIVALALLCLGGLFLLLQRSWGGLRVRGVMQNRDMAACLGVSTRRVDAVTFALGTALAGVAGCALALIGTVDPEVGKTYIVDAFMVVVLGGVGKLLGTVVAAFGIGVSNKLLEPALGGTAAAIYAKVAILAAVIWFLQWRPTGLFPARGRAAAETR